MCEEGMVCGAMSIFTFWDFFREYVIGGHRSFSGQDIAIQARRQFHPRNTSQMCTFNHARHCCQLPLRIPRAMASVQTPGTGTRNAERNQKKHIGDHNN